MSFSCVFNCLITLILIKPHYFLQTDASWNDNLWQPYPYLYDVPTHYHTCKSASWMNNTDLRGDVFLSFEVRLNKGRTQHDYARVCSNICCREERCRSWTLRFQNASTRNCPKSENFLRITMVRIAVIYPSMLSQGRKDRV